MASLPNAIAERNLHPRNRVKILEIACSSHMDERLCRVLLVRAMDSRSQLRRIRILLLIFIFGLALSGATAIPLETELKLLAQWLGSESGSSQWFFKVRDALIETNAKYPFMAYGTDWLAFAHFVIAIAFIGPLRDPVRNIWVIEFGMIACLLLIPFALVMGSVRGIPLGWRLIDCSFGVLGIVPLWLCREQIKRLAAGSKAS